ncbi:hypothetical protein AB0395_46770, partial [Streptosporangium sp. NPDC051023]
TRVLSGGRPAMKQEPSRATVGIPLVHEGEDVKVVEVYDGNRNAPVVMAPGEGGESGRGMALVAGLARSWGFRDTRLGKAVFFELLAWP